MSISSEISLLLAPVSHFQRQNSLILYFAVVFKDPLSAADAADEVEEPTVSNGVAETSEI